MNKIDMAELNYIVQMTAGAIFFVTGIVGLLFFGYAMGY